MNKCKSWTFWTIKKCLSCKFWQVFEFFNYRCYYKVKKKKLGYDLYSWRNCHFREFLFDVHGYNYPIYVGIWRDFRDLKPYFVICKKRYIFDTTKLARVDFKTGEILHDKNIFRRLKLSEKDIQNVYEVLNHKLHYAYLYDTLTQWDEIKYYWNDSCYEHVRNIDMDAYYDGKYDERKRKNKWFIPSDTPIPNIHYKNKKRR